jgi:FHA domain
MQALLHGPSGRIPLGLAVATMGRAPDNHLVIPGASVALHHATIRSVGFGGRRSYSLFDQGSSMGTFVNEQRLTSHQPHLLTPGDQIRIGSTGLIDQASAASLATPPDSLPAATAVQGREHLPSPASTGLARVTVPTFLRQRRGLLLVVLGVVLLAGVIGITRLSQPPSAGILDTYCAALTDGDYHTVYQQLSPRLQKAGSEQQPARLLALDKVTTCSHGPVSQSGTRATATLSLVHASGVKSEDVVVLLLRCRESTRVGRQQWHRTQRHYAPDLPAVLQL